ncbi:MAG TPA: hypothetical protein VK538_10435, partial [Solirubrobacteraceae bacterium]|nr:hypothetical protein [Solirubrobacteraceae bacterium]
MRDPQITVRWADDPHDVSAALALREQVFCGEQGVPPSVEIDRLDERAMHAVALAQARERGARRARLASQLGATALYEHAGFAVESEPFKDAGIDHVWMG